ncbi:fungal-specific transcription factor domain-containing protein [Melanogaster broomeanus]|nr:fungal-specific transcription factor domain-containing protein [Melanogaster broomeanus]
MKCDFPEGATSCKRCTSSNYPCIVEGRKPRIAPNKREYLLAQIRHKDQMIGSLLKQLHNPYIATPLSIDQFKLAMSPSDTDNIKVVDWMVESSTRPTGEPSAARMEVIRKLRDPGAGAGTAMDESDDSDDVDEETTEEEEAERVRSALPDAAVPIGLLANLSLDIDKDKVKGKSRQGGDASSSAVRPDDDDDNVGVANKEYFMPGPANDLNIRKNLIERHSPPDIVLHGLVTSADVDKLFEIFWNQVNPFIGLLDPKLHTTSSIFQRCPFLFTAICAISSRYCPEKSNIYPVAMHFAKHSAANALIDGWKSVELCQAYILMSIYAVPARRWEEDRSWLYTGLAVRVATDLNLHQVSLSQPQTERQEREMLNRTRVWMICFNLDRSTATQFGKPSTINDDYIMRNSADWYKGSQYRDKYDIHMCAQSSLLRILGRFHDEIFSDPNSPTGLNKVSFAACPSVPAHLSQSIDFLAVTLQHDAHVTTYFEEWTKRFNEESDPDDPGCRFRCTLLPFLVNYSRLVMYSFGFQHAFQRGIEPSDNVFLTKCFEAATAIIKHMVEILAPSSLMRSAPDGHFVFASFASAFLLKLLRPEFVDIITQEMEDEIFDSIGRLITTLQDVAVDERHTPGLYARFLAGLLTKHRKGGGAVAGRLQQLPPTSQVAHQHQPQSYSGQQTSSTSRMQYSGMHSQSGSEPRHDTDAMQMQMIPLSNLVETPPPPSTTVFRPEVAYTQGQPPLPLGGSSTVSNAVSMTDVLSDAGTLATMQALNDVWWGNMMMPGFSWPEAPPMSSMHDGQLNGIPGIHPGFGGFQIPEVAM